MKSPRLPRPFLPWALLLAVALGGGGFGLFRLLTVEVLQWGILYDAEHGFLPPSAGAYLEAPRSTDARCDSLSLRRLFPDPKDSTARRDLVARMMPRAALLPRLDEAFRSRPELAVSDQWCHFELVSTTFRSTIALPIRIGLDFPIGMTSRSPQGSLDAWRLGPVIGSRLPRSTHNAEEELVVAGNRSLFLGSDTAGFLAFEGSIPSPGRVEILHPGADTVCFVNRGRHALHDFAAQTTAFQPGRSGRTARLEPGRSFCLTEPGNLPDARAYALERGLGEVQARAFANRWGEQQIGSLPKASVQWSAWLDPAAVESALPFRLGWPLGQVRRHILLVHREPILDTNGCPDRQDPRLQDFPSEATEFPPHRWPTPAEMLRAERMRQQAEWTRQLQESLANPHPAQAPSTLRSQRTTVLKLGVLHLKGGSKRSPESVSRVLRAHLPGLRLLVQRSRAGTGTPPVGALRVRFTVSPEGSVVAVEVQGKFAETLREEVRDKISRYRFAPLGEEANCVVAVTIEATSVPAPNLELMGRS